VCIGATEHPEEAPRSHEGAVIMDRNWLVFCGAVVLATAGLLVAASYEWTGGGPDNEWDDCRN